MAVNVNWPLVVDSFAFVGDPNDPTSTPSYTDLSPRVRTFEASRGRQYEIDQNQTGEAHLTVSDSDEVLNPANTAAPAPFQGNIKPYRRYLRQAMWPPVPVGAAVNLLNATAGYDPSFENTAVGATPPNMLTFNTSPTVQAANPFSGTKSLQWSVLGNSTQQSVGFTVPTIPGQQYTASVYYRQTAANTGVLFVNNGPASTTTTTTAAYVRLTVTFTATAPTHQLFVGSFTPTLASTVNVDAIQLEPGATASAFSLTGPVIYTPFSGYVERWPSSWNHQGTYGLCTLACVDAMATLAGTDLHTEYRSMLATKKPDLWWPLADGSNATTFAEVSGNNGPPLARRDGKYGPAQAFAAGAATNIAGDPGGTGVTFTYNMPTGSNVGATVLQVGAGSTPPMIGLGGPPPVTFTVAFWLTHIRAISGTDGASIIRISDRTEINAILDMYLQLLPASSLAAQVFSKSGQSPIAGGVVTDTWADGKPHLYIATVTIGAANANLSLYIDGTSRITATAATTTWIPPYAPTMVQLGGLVERTFQDGSTSAGLPDPTYAHLAIWNRVLSLQEIADLWTAGKGYAGETSGQRIARLLSIGGYTGPTAIDGGQSIMGISTVTEGAALLDACQQVTLSENGNFYAEAGVVTAKSRTDRYLKIVSKWVFGERQDLGEAPYEPDIAYDYDPSRVVNDVSVSRVGGTKANAHDDASQKQYFRRSYQRTINVQSDLETIDAANYLLGKGKQPIQRISRLSIKPSANPALWPVALGVRIGDRVTVKRRTTTFTMSADFFIEKVEHRNEAGSWITTFQMSPVDQTKAGIFDDATYGRFDSTLIFGY